MAFPPHRISIKRRRDEDPVSTLYIQTDSSSTTQRESKRHRSEYVFKRVHEVPQMDLHIYKSGEMVGGKETVRASSMAAANRAGDGIRRTETGVPIVIALGGDAPERESALGRDQAQILAMRPVPPHVSKEKMEKMGSDTAILSTGPLAATATAVVSEENKTGRSDEAGFLSMATVTPPSTKELTSEEQLKAMGLGRLLSTPSLSKKRSKSPPMSPEEMPLYKKLRTFRLQRPSTDTSNQGATSPAFRGIKKIRKSPKLGVVFVEDKSKGKNDNKKQSDATEARSEPIHADGDRKVSGEAIIVDSQTPTTSLPDHSVAQPQKKPNRDKEESARRAIRIATSSFGAGKLKYQPKPPPPRSQRAASSNGLRSGTQQMHVPDAATQDSVDDEAALIAKLEAFTMEVLAESNIGGAPVYSAPVPASKPARQHTDAMSLSSDSDSEADYIMDTYIRVPVSPSHAGVPDPTDPAAQMAQDVGILHIPREDEELLGDWFVNEHSSSDERDDEWEEDSNAEDAVGNDYPEEEEPGDQDSDDDGEYEVYEYRSMERKRARRLRVRGNGDSDFEEDDEDGDDKAADDKGEEGTDGFQGGEDWAWEVR